MLRSFRIFLILSLLFHIISADIHQNHDKSINSVVSDRNNQKSKGKNRKLDLGISKTSNNTKLSFSGLYTPNTKFNMEAYSASWLVTRDRYLNKLYIHITQIGNLEGATFAVVASGQNLMTRDYYDMFIVHLSITTNLIPELNKLDLKLDTGREFVKRMKYTVDTLKSNSLSKVSQSPAYDTRYRVIQKSTVCLIPFNLASGSHIFPNMPELNIFLGTIKFQYLEATFWSVYRYFSKVVVACASQVDIDAIKALNLPIWRYVDLSKGLTSTYLLPKHALTYLYHKLNGTDATGHDPDDEIWKSFKYIYYTESDQILYTRRLPIIFQALDDLPGDFAILPHRMQSAPLPKSFTDEQQSLFRGWSRKRMEDLKKVDLIVEDPILPKGSCCDDGRFVFTCGHQFWYQCEKIGFQNYSTWVRFGEHGYTMPLGTEHQAKCKHSSVKVTCPKPPGCSKRVPSRSEEVCQEYPDVVHVSASG